MKKNLLSLLLLSFIALSSAFAQSRTINGKVLSADDGMPLPGVSIKVQGTTTGTQTNTQGEYSLVIPDNAKILIFTFIGYVDQNLVIGGQKIINVKLVTNARALSEVVVVGYGTGTKAANVVGSVAVVGQKDIEDRPVANAFDALQGKVAGLNILSSSGEPSSTPSISLHGIGSLTANTTPLIVMDGIPIDPGTVLSLNPDDFAEVVVLKDASSTSIYGSRAANGVLYLTTKKGSANKPASVTLTTQYSVSQLANTDFYNSFLNTSQYTNFVVATGQQTQAQVNTTLQTYNADTKWYKTYYKNNVPTYQTNINVSGGGGKTTYYVSGGYFKQEGLAYRSAYDRYTLRSNVNSAVTNWLSFGLNLSMGYDERNQNPYGSNSTNRGLGLLALPYYSPTDANGNNYDFIPGWGRYHPQYLANEVLDPNNNTQFNPSGYIQLTPIKGLTIKSVGGMDDYDYRESSIRLPSYLGSLNNGSTQEIFTRGISKTFTNTAEYKFTVATVHHVTVLGGQEYTDGQVTSFNGITTGQTDDRLILLSAGSTGKNAGSSNTEYSYKSLFGTLDYNYNEKYFIRGSLRQDQSSRFGVDNRTGRFWSVGATWKAKEENFLKEINWLTDLSVRASTGTAGNSLGFGNYAPLATVGSTSYNAATGIAINAPGNPALAWESQRNTNFTVNTTLFDRVNLEVSYYIRSTSNMLINVPFPYTSGFSAVTENTGTLQNKGVDVDLSVDVYKNREHKAYITPYVRFGIVHDKVTALFQGKNLFVQPNTGVAWVIGQPVTFIYPIFAGINPATGIPSWYNPGTDIGTKNADPNNTTTTFNATSLQQNTGIARNPWLAGSFGLNASYEGFTLSADFYFVKGKSLINNDRYFYENPNQFPGFNQTTRILDYWKNPGDVTLFPKYGVQFTQFDSRLIEDASFIRLKNLTLGYSVPTKLLERTKAIKGLNIFVTGRDLLTWTKYLGPDPEVDSNLSLGADPNTKQYSLGVKVTF